jgi:hypothetical protein
MWVPLIEKAYAKIHGSYKSLAYGFTRDALVDLTGGISFSKTITNESYKDEEFWEFLSKCYDQKLQIPTEYVMGASFSTGGGKEKELGNTGLHSGHAYAIIKTAVVNKNERLVQLRNPWGFR